jgi:hypothetical protein
MTEWWIWTGVMAALGAAIIRCDGGGPRLIPVRVRARRGSGRG